jgi:nucleotide-binding universal stress UspA family protein
MIKLRRILCPTDLSTESDEALRYAVALASAYDAKLILFHCSKTETEAEPQPAKLFSTSLAPHLGITDPRELEWEGVIARDPDNVGEAIVEAALKLQTDLIVMRSRRRGRVAVLLGSTAETVSELAPCPVLVTHPREREWVGMATGEIDLRRVLVPCDFSSDSALALEYGFSLAEEYQAEVHLLHVLSPAGQAEPELAWSTSKEGSAYKLVAQKLQQAVPKEAYLWCKVVTAVRVGKAFEEVLAYAKDNEIDLICLGASGDDSTLSKVLGSNVDRVLRQAPCPVFIARPSPVSAVYPSVETLDQARARA